MAENQSKKIPNILNARAIKMIKEHSGVFSDPALALSKLEDTRKKISAMKMNVRNYIDHGFIADNVNGAINNIESPKYQKAARNIFSNQQRIEQLVTYFVKHEGLDLDNPEAEAKIAEHLKDKKDNNQNKEVEKSELRQADVSQNSDNINNTSAILNPDVSNNMQEKTDFSNDYDMPENNL